MSLAPDLYQKGQLALRLLCYHAVKYWDKERRLDPEDICRVIAATIESLERRSN